MATQGVNFDFTSAGADALARDFRKTGDNATLAAKGARLAADAIEKQRKAASVSAGASLALAKADSILAEAEHGLADGALEAEFALKKQAEAEKKAALAALEVAAAEKKAARETAAARRSSGGSAAPSLAGVVGTLGLAGVASGALGILPAVAAAGLGVASFGALALPTLKGISTAMTQVKTDTTAYDRATTAAGRNTALAHIRQDWAKLSPGQAAAVKGIQALQAGFGKLATALAPLTLKVLNDGLKVASGLLPDLAKFARPAGEAVDGLLKAFGNATQSAGFKDFVNKMAGLSGPAITTIGRAFGTLAGAVGKFLLGVASPGGLSVFTGAVGGLSVALTGLGAAFGWISKHVNAGILHDLGIAILGVYAAVKLWAAAQAVLDAALAANPIGLIAIAVAAVGAAFFEAWKHSAPFRDVIKDIGKVFLQIGIIILSVNKVIVVSFLNMVGTIIDGAARAFGWVPGLGSKLRSAAAMFDHFKSGVGGAFDAMIGKLHDWQGALDASKNKANTATQVITGDFGKQLIATNASQRGVNNLAVAIGQLRGKTVNVGVHASGSGGMTFTQKVAASISSGGFSLRSLARGGVIDLGTGPTADDVPAMLSRGETVVSTAHSAHPVMQAAFRAVGVPGYASGGIAGMTPFAAGAEYDFGHAVEAALLQAEFANLKKAVAAAAKASAARAASGGPGVAGPGGGAPAANAALARKLMPSWGSGAEWNAWNALEMQEAGWNQFARNPSSGAYGIPQALPPGKMGAAANPPQSNPTAQIRWMIGYIQSVYGDPIRAEQHELANHWYAKGGLVPGYASGGVAGQGSAYLKAWQSRHGGPYGLAVGPKVLNEQIAEMAAAVSRAKALAGAGGLSAGQHRFWANAAAGESRLLATYGKELTTERAWRDQLGMNELGLDKEIRAAGNLPSLAGPVRGWKAALGRDKATVAAISKMLGYSNAFIAAHPGAAPGKPPVPTGVQAVHSYGGDVANNIGTVLAAALGPFTGAARGGMVSYDRGGWLKPGATMAWNGTGRPEMVVPARGGGGGTLKVEWVGGSGGDELLKWIRKNVRFHGGTGPGAVDRAFGSR